MFRQDKRGSVAVISALSISVVAAGAAFGVEMSYYNYDQLRLQQAADTGAYAAAIELRGGSDAATARAAALTVAQQNGYNASTDTATLTTPAPGAASPNSARFIITRNETRTFSAIFTSSGMTVQAGASSAWNSAASACVLALDPSASRAINISGNTSVSLVGCSVMADSIAADAVNVQGSAQITVPCLYAVGGIADSGGATLTACDSVQGGMPPIGDPYAGFAYPTPTGNCLSANGSTLQPGRYCGGMSLSGNVTLNPGTYFIEGGSFRINANANVVGTGVTFILTNGATLSFNGNGHENLTAPTTGPMAGMLIVGARNNVYSDNTINGDNTSHMTGTIYFPSQSVSYLGNFSGQNGCTQIVARTVTWSGSTSVAVDCSAFGMTEVPAVQAVRLIG